MATLFASFILQITFFTLQEIAISGKAKTHRERRLEYYYL